MTIIESDHSPQALLDGDSDQAPLASGWFDDPVGRHRLRFFDGETWTDHVTHFGPAPCTGCG